MQFWSFNSLANRFVPEESRNTVHERGYGLVRQGPNSLWFRKELSSKLGLNDVIRHADAVIVYSEFPEVKEDTYKNCLAVYRLIPQKDGSYHIAFFKGQTQIMEHILNEKYPFISSWTVESGMMTPLFWESLGFKNGKLIRKVSIPNVGDCVYCKYEKAKFLNPELNTLFCSKYCFDGYERTLK